MNDTAPPPPISPVPPPSRLQQSLTLRLLLLLGLCLLLQIPIQMIRGVIGERQATRDEAVAEVTQSWGQAQTLTGPVLVLPYEQRVRDDKGVEQLVTRRAFFLPETLRVKGSVQTERRSRGIFSVPLYRGSLEIEGELRAPELAAWSIAPSEVRWEAAELVLGLSDLRAIRGPVSVRWDGQEHALEPGRGGATFLGAGVHLPQVPGLRGGPPERLHRFSLTLPLAGSSRLLFTPTARDSEVALTSAWPDPSFNGAFLPTERQIGAAGFSARWRVPHLSRNYPQRWLEGEVSEAQLAASAFGVSFASPGDAYSATTRAVKYELLFVSLTFLVFFLFELFYGMRIHPVQYLLVGAALCLFYLLLLALSEHLGFALSYLNAAGAVVAVVTGYCASVLRRRRLVLVVAAGLSALYGFLFVLLQMEDHALLAGAIGLFLVLALVMYVTRRVDWYRALSPAPVESAPAAP